MVIRDLANLDMQRKSFQVTPELGACYSCSGQVNWSYQRLASPNCPNSLVLIITPLPPWLLPI